MDLFLEEYERNGGNRTEAAMKVFNCTSRASAAQTGSVYLRKAQDLGAILMEKKGLSLENLIEKASVRMDNPKSQDFVALFDRFMKMGGYHDFLTKQGVTKSTISVMGVQKSLLDEYVEGEIIDDEQDEGE